MLAALFVVVLPLLVSGPAHAEGPITLSRTGQITDKVGALGDRKGEVTQALDKLYDDNGIQLFVAYVRDFSGQSAKSWANSTAERNGLGLDDILLAVATHDRQYAYSVDQDSRLTEAQLQQVATTAIEPALKQNDWAGAAIGAANGCDAVLSGQPVPAPAITPGDPDPGAAEDHGPATGDLVLPVVAVGSAGALAAYAYTRGKRKKNGGGPGGAAPGWSQGPAPTPLPELDKKARLLLVETDDAVRTSTEELGFAAAQFGDDAVKRFQDAVTYAKGELTAAFKLRQQLDDAFPEDDTTKRRMLDEIVSRCSEASRRLDAETADFDRLRALEQNAPAALTLAEGTFREVSARTTAAAGTYTTLTTRYADSAAAPVSGHIEEAKERLLFATGTLNQARQAVDTGENGQAAVYLRAAEGAVDQAGTLVDAVERLAQELGQAEAKLPGALTETETDLADARGLLQGTTAGTSTADLQGRIARAETVLQDVRAVVAGGRYDPIDALRRIEEADAALDEALSGAREREVADQRARGLLDQTLLTARSAVSAAADYITTHRGGVGSEARTRLAEAQRHLASADALAATDASGALARAQQADSMARQAQQLAERDAQSFDPYGGPYAGRSRSGGTGGAVLGGIILGEVLGGMGRGMGGGFGGGYGRGGGGGGGFGGPGSFGGGGTRGRMGGGGRF
ncbi:TPM domain-containing protein [Streptomyces sp. TRM66268-LWL]|uniref:TPM domain-containing protein n=1 Tax=Streptomyces polyasparticus TaxID=2767826 RepID=A0ABR7S6D1_9ACTN|nr:TPM domain-containing protein [Streptomyces polyasparticus]